MTKNDMAIAQFFTWHVMNLTQCLWFLGQFMMDVGGVNIEYANIYFDHDWPITMHLMFIVCIFFTVHQWDWHSHIKWFSSSSFSMCAENTKYHINVWLVIIFTPTNSSKQFRFWSVFDIEALTIFCNLQCWLLIIFTTVAINRFCHHSS